VKQGRQAFVVCPRIDEADPGDELIESGGAAEPEPEYLAGDDTAAVLQQAKAKPPMAAVVAMTAALKAMPVLAGLRIEALHGRLTNEEKTEVMGRFAAGTIDILVSTTVIEVGVDVPNATVMVVLDADRFGVSQLHQLRGRVGRGGNPGLCLLLTAAESGSLALERVQAVASTTDGFELSEVDLALRREGDVLGANQSGGKSSLNLLRVIQDAELIQSAREFVAATFEADPTLEKHLELAESLNRIDQAAQENLAKG
jgi:ATP-dependent DNA helicase RecG